MEHITFLISANLPGFESDIAKLVSKLDEGFKIISESNSHGVVIYILEKKEC